MKKLVLFTILLFVISLVSVNAQEEEGFSVLYGVSPDTIWESELTDFQKFMIRFNNLISPQTVLGGVDYDCSLNSYRVGEALSGRTYRLISTTKEVPSGADWVRTELRDLTYDRSKGSTFNEVGIPVRFDNLNPAITYQWFQFACYPKDVAPTNFCGDVGGSCQYNNGANCLSGYSKISGVCPSLAYACCKQEISGHICETNANKYNCFGDGFVSQCVGGTFASAKRCSTLGNYDNVCITGIEDLRNSITEVCKEETEPSGDCANGAVLEGKYVCFGDGFVSQCKEGTFLSAVKCSVIDSTLDNICAIHETEGSGTIAEVCKIKTAPVCTPTTEICDGIDNDCDGLIDEGCELEPSDCVDSDVTETYPSGENFYVKGTVTDSGITFEDKCNVDNIRLNEFYCVSPSEPILKEGVATNIFECPKGCDDGKCIKSIVDPFICCQFSPTTTQTEGCFNVRESECVLGLSRNIRDTSYCGINGGCVLPPVGGKESLTEEEIKMKTETELQESLCVKSTECKERFGYNVRCAGDKKIVDLVKDKVGSIESFFIGVEGICFAEQIGEEKFDINPCVWGEALWEDNGCLAGWGIVVIVLLLIFFGGRRK